MVQEIDITQSLRASCRKIPSFRADYLVMHRHPFLFVFFLPVFLLVGCFSSGETPEERTARIQHDIQEFIEQSGLTFQADQDGLWVHILSPGDSIQPELSSIVTVAYAAAGLNGTVVDSANAGQPLRSRLSRLVTGWQQALPMIGQGGSMRLILAPELAYGPRSIHPDLGPWAPMVFDISLLQVELLRP